MHEPVIDSLEEILGGGTPAPAAETHLKACAECREEVAALASHSRMFQALRAPELEPTPGFYARVINRVEREVRPSIWSLFGESVFARRLAFASMSLTILLGTYMLSSADRATIVNAPESIMADGGQYETVSNGDSDQDRETVLVHLATYED